ncbi:MAG TPA: phospho-N-acetylmuramoyl-pentapeptide-transferase [Chthoniobacteraceae bacterium]|nr:phospho-N-acetylmuramoyl-pentapeptide-transferase [Chthoniobacteraceae bacterium]
MMYFLYKWIHEYFGPNAQPPETLKALNVLQYITFRSMGAAITAFLLCLVFGDRVIRKLISLKVGQPIRTKEEVHKLSELHGGKRGTPTMGGVLLLGAVVVSTLIWGRPDMPVVWLALFTIVYLGAIGFIDDYLKVSKKKSDGLSGRLKLVAQFALAGLVTWFFLRNPATDVQARMIFVPFYKSPLVSLGGLAGACLVFLFYSGIIVGSSNAVNLTDGLDGLATGCTIIVASAYAVLAYCAGHEKISTYLEIPFYSFSGELTVLCMALVGAGLGFLWFNCHPAKVFMGDTGSLAIGGFLGVVAICCKQELLMLIVGGVFVIEAMSVILQVLSFKLTGKRIFAMSPIHHHFELKGWKENTVIVRFWIISIIFAFLGLATLKLR